MGSEPYQTTSRWNMANQIIKDLRSTEPETAFILVVGENRVKGIAQTLGVHDIYPECRWITNELEKAG